MRQEIVRCSRIFNQNEGGIRGGCGRYNSVARLMRTSSLRNQNWSRRHTPIPRTSKQRHLPFPTRKGASGPRSTNLLLGILGEPLEKAPKAHTETFCVTYLEEGVPEVGRHGHHLVLREQPRDFSGHEHRVHDLQEHLRGQKYFHGVNGERVANMFDMDWSRAGPNVRGTTCCRQPKEEAHLSASSKHAHIMKHDRLNAETPPS